MDDLEQKCDKWLADVKRMNWPAGIAALYLAEFVTQMAGRISEEAPLRAYLVNLRRDLEEKDFMHWRKEGRRPRIDEIDELLGDRPTILR